MLTAEERARVAVVLVRARNPANIGAVARAMHDFGFGQLRAVSEYLEPVTAARSAVDAGEVIAAATTHAGLAEGVADRTLVLGTTAVGARVLEHPVWVMAEAAERVAAHLRESGGHRVALVFGSEKTGLSNAELAHCHALVTIPMAAHAGVRHASMNLGQAAAVCLYELVRVAAAPEFGPGHEEGGFLAAEMGAGDRRGVSSATELPPGREKEVSTAAVEPVRGTRVSTAAEVGPGSERAIAAAADEGPGRGLGVAMQVGAGHGDGVIPAAAEVERLRGGGVATAAEVERLRALFVEVLERTGYTRRYPANSDEDVVRRMVVRTASRTGATAAEVGVWMGVLRQVLWAMRGDGA